MDFAIRAGFYDLMGTADTGRPYLLRSDNSPAPALPAQPPEPGSPRPTSPPVALAGRAIELDASRNVVRLRGAVEAFTDQAGCQSAQPVELQVRRAGTQRYTRVTQLRSDAQGNFATTITVRTTGRYRARLAQTAGCLGAVSNRETIAVPPAISAVTTITRLTASRVVRVQLSCPRGTLCSRTVKLRTASAIRRLEAQRQRVTLGTRGFQIPG